MQVTASLARLRYKYVPEHLVGELLTKRWIDTAIPFIFLVATVAWAGASVPEFFSSNYLGLVSRDLGEFGIVVLAMMIVVIAGGIDLSVGSNFALGNIIALLLIGVAGWPVWLVLPAVVVVCAGVGAVNGLLIGYLRLRAFITTLVMLIIVRAIADLLVLKFSTQLLGSEEPSFLWDLLGTGTIAGMPTSFAILLLLAVVAHLVISRGRIGWHLLAIGGSRRSAYNAGIPVRRTVCLTYVAAGALVGLAGALYAARLGGAGGGTGLSYEISALTAVVAGGISLGGGRGSVPKAMMGAIIVFLITNTLLRLGASSGASPMLLGAVLLLAVAVDVKWNKNRSKILAKVYVSPAYLPMPPMPETSRGSQSAYAVNDRLAQVDKFGLDRLEGPEDPVLDRAGNLYCGTRQGDIMRLLAPDYEHIEVFAHIGSHPLGLAIDRDDSIVACVPGMGLYKVTKDREVIRLTDETNRTRWSVLDDSRLRLADDLDIAPDGRIFFSEATTRFGIERWIYDVQESRGNGRIICYDPSTKTTRTVLRNLVFPNGICMAGDGESLLFAETWASRVSRYWFDGPNKGQVAAVVPDLPGLPDNINRASDGNFWVALTGMRTPSMDLALSMPGFRRRMARRIAPDELLFPNLNIGCIAKINLAGEVLDVLWDASGVDHPAVTSVREDRGYLYIGGLYNNRIGRIPLRDADPEFNGPVSYWGERERQSVTA